MIMPTRREAIDKRNLVDKAFIMPGIIPLKSARAAHFMADDVPGGHAVTEGLGGVTAGEAGVGELLIGVGGGSLIYANIFVEPKPFIFDVGWPVNHGGGPEFTIGVDQHFDAI